VILYKNDCVLIHPMPTESSSVSFAVDRVHEIADAENVWDEYRYIRTLEGVQLHGSTRLIEKTKAHVVV